MKRLVLIDGNALLHRAYHATPPFTTSLGELVNAVYGFSSMLLKVISELHPEFIAITWDEKGPTFRHQVYTQYKATRGPTDDGLIGQYKRVHEVVQSFNIPEFKLAGYEADDLIATLVNQATKFQVPSSKFQTIIVTGDRDIMQLISPKVKVFMPRKTLSDVGLYGVEEFVAKYGFFPPQLLDYKGLAGDPSDNIPGVPGIGEVTATKLIHQFRGIEEIYKEENLKTLPPRLQMLLAEGAESAVMSKKLATLDLNAPIKLDLAKCTVHDFDKEKVVKLFQELEFKSLIAKIPNSSVVASASLSLRDHEVAKQSSQFVEDRHPCDSRSLPRTLLRGSLRVNYPRDDNTQNNKTSDLDREVDQVLQKMSQTGVLIDLKFLNRFGEELKSKLANIEQEIYSKVGHQFNLNSPKQLSEVLFDELKLPVIRKTKTGRSTDENTLNELFAVHPVVPLFLQYRELFKLISTYIDALPKYADSQGRIHSTFNVEGAVTGRISSKDPNLQNIPVKGETGGEIRKAFIAPARGSLIAPARGSLIAPKDKVLLAADYSQIELRIMAHLAEDPGLLKAFEQGLDIHAATASKVFQVPIDQVSREQRMVGKTMNFATLYGQGPHALARDLKVDFATARGYITEYFARFPKVREWMEKTLAFGYEHGFVETVWGRKRYIPELKASNRAIKSAGERAAINAPVQGTAADMIKKAMVEIDLSLRAPPLAGRGNLSTALETGLPGPERGGTPCQMILQVHDELLFECDGPASSPQVQKLAKMVKDKMENALKLCVPVVVDLKVGPNWGEMEPLKEVV